MSGPSNRIPANVADFIFRHIDSLEQLEVLGVLRDRAERDWSPEEVNNVVRSSVSSVTNRLDTLVSHGLARRSDSNRYSYISDNPHNETIADLFIAYRDRRVAVIELIFSKPLKGIHSFSEAFKLKEDK